MISAALLFVATASFGLPAAADPPNACALLERDDLAVVQGEPYTEAKLTSNGKVSRCFYQLPTFTASVSLDVVEDSEGALWETLEGESSDEESDHPRPREKEVEKDELNPIRVSGVGDEAFWLGNAAGATLWVRQGDLTLRVSVGGSGTQTEKIERSKRLAIKALDKIAKTTKLPAPEGGRDRPKTDL